MNAKGKEEPVCYSKDFRAPSEGSNKLTRQLTPLSLSAKIRPLKLPNCQLFFCEAITENELIAAMMSYHK